MGDEPYITSDAVAEFFGVKPATVLDWRKTLGLPAHRIGGKRGGILRFKMSEVQIWALRFRPTTRPTTRGEHD
jgi:hypothetical protein